MVCFVREMAGRAWLIQVSKTFFVNFSPSSVSWGPQLAIDGTTAYYHSRNGASEASGYGDYLQASHVFAGIVFRLIYPNVLCRLTSPLYTL